ncbi:MAG: ATP phosphoribosyltransferase [Planctomycetes bacterium]|nr:ATP phosphoribosyltransferase [Planctomycetota bacterium]
MITRERLAIPKKGRVYEQVMNLMVESGLQLKRRGRLDFCVCESLGIEVYFLPAKDIPNAVASGAIHYGVTGIDLIQNSHAQVDTHLNLGIGRARMVLASPEAKPYKDISSLNGKRIGSSYTALAENFLKENGVKDYKMVHFDGSVEIQVALGVVDAIVDITETGSSLAANNLEIRETILTSEMVLISSKGYEGDVLDILLKRIKRVMRGRSHVMLKFNISNDLIEKACSLSHGMSSPTVNHLADGDWAALEVAIDKKELHSLMDQLIQMGAKGILSHSLSLCAPD